MLLSVYIERYVIEVEAVSVNISPSLKVRHHVTYSHKNKLNYVSFYILMFTFLILDGKRKYSDYNGRIS
jgi:hypothetical protein